MKDWKAIKGWFSESDARALLPYLSGTVLELGSYMGRSTVFISGHCDKVVSVDPHQGGIGVEGKKLKEPTWVVFKRNLALAGRTNVVPIRGFSWQGMVESRVRMHGPYSFIFIDSLHTYAAALADFERYKDLAPFVGFHDMASGAYKGLTRLRQELIKQYELVAQGGSVCVFQVS